MDPPRGTHLGTKGGPAEEERTSGLRVNPPRGIHLRTKGGPFKGECTWEQGWALQGDTPGDQGWTLQGGAHLATNGGPAEKERTWGLRVDLFKNSRNMQGLVVLFFVILFSFIRFVLPVVPREILLLCSASPPYESPQ